MKFEKVSKEAWIKQCEKLGIVDAEKYYDNIKIPARSTAGSCGYDFVCPINILVTTEKTVMVPTGIRAFLDKGTFLMLCPRSSCIKKGFAFPASLGIIDEDYVNADNEGNIMTPIISTGKVNSVIEFKVGDKIAQGIILPYITAGDVVETTRTGGFGSTDESEEVKALEFTDEVGIKDEVKVEEKVDEEEAGSLTEADMSSLFKDIPEQDDIEDEVAEKEPESKIDKVEETEDEKEEEEVTIPKYIAFNNKFVVSNVFPNRVVIHEINYMINAIKNINTSMYFNLLKKKNSIKSLEEISPLFAECSEILASSESEEDISASFVKDIVITLVYGDIYKEQPEKIEKIVALLLDIRSNGDVDKIAKACGAANVISADRLDKIIEELTELKG